MKSKQKVTCVCICFYSFTLSLSRFSTKIFKWCRKSQDSYKTLLLTTTDEDLKEDNKMLFAQDYVSLPSELTFWWTNWLLALGYNRALEITDLGSLPVKHETKVNHVKFSKAFRAEQVWFDFLPSLARIYRKRTNFNPGVNLETKNQELVQD